MLEQCAGRLIGRDPQYIEQLWQDMSRAFFYPAGREKEDAIGALDLALWDMKGKVLQLPVHQILGGAVRNYCECYNTAGMHSRCAARNEHSRKGATDHRGRIPGFSHGRGRRPSEHDITTHMKS